ncbi:MAG: UDP-4-amino-4,6-dideoxy-N-acetyl-beta-L-altrosamine N-acetyltransferase [Paracoccaceae bacterium]
MNERLRPVVPEDSDDLLCWRNAEHVRKFVFHQQPIPSADHEAWFKGILNNSNCAYLVYERDRKPGGVVSFTDIDPRNRSANWGFYTVPDAPKGTGRAMLTLALEYAFSTLGLHTVCAAVLDYNAASLHLHHTLGFARTDIQRNGHQVDGTFHDVILFAKTATTDI